MRGYSRDMNIGKPNMKREVDVKNFKEVTKKIDDAQTVIEEGNLELRRHTLGLSILAEEDLTEED